MILTLERIYNLFGALYLCIIRFKSVSFKYGLSHISSKLCSKFEHTVILYNIAIFLGALTVLLIGLLSGLYFEAYAMEPIESEFVKVVSTKQASSKVIVNSLLIDLQSAKFRIVPYSVVQENDPKFFKHVLETSNVISFNGKYIGVGYPYTKDPIRSIIENIIITPNRFDAVRNSFQARAVNRKIVYSALWLRGLNADFVQDPDLFSKKLNNFFIDSTRRDNRAVLNTTILRDSCIDSSVSFSYTFIEYVQGAKLPNDKIFMFSNKTKFCLKPFLSDISLRKNESTNIGLLLSDNNITLIFNNEILYNKGNKFDFNLLRPELLKSEIICNTVKIFSIRETVVDALNTYYFYTASDKAANFSFHPTNYNIDSSLHTTSLNFTFNDEDTLD